MDAYHAARTAVRVTLISLNDSATATRRPVLLLPGTVDLVVYTVQYMQLISLERR